MRLSTACLATATIVFAANLSAQQPSPAPAAASSTISVFLDCQNVYCDEDYMRTEIKAVNWVRDRAVADVHILVTGEDTGAGGRAFTSTFIGLRAYAGLTDTLSFTLPPAFTDDERRSGMARTFRAGLVRYIARTPNAKQMSVDLGGAGAGASASQTSTKADPWKAWVFRVGFDGYAEGEETYKGYGINGRFSANRVTEHWKTQFSARENYNQSEYETSDTTTDIVIRKNYNASFLQAKSLTTHWSAGLRADFTSSTYDNTKRQIRVTPAIEFNVYPYSQSTRRVFKFEYGIGMQNVRYADTTIFDKIEENLPLHRLSSSVSVKQPWGSIDANVVATQYLHDMSKYRVGSFLGLNLRLFKGFETYTFGNYEMIYDQLSLQKKNYTPQQILLRQFQRGTTYRFWVNMGISYTFGSIYNNVVNPRFDQ